MVDRLARRLASHSAVVSDPRAASHPRQMPGVRIEPPQMSQMITEARRLPVHDEAQTSLPDLSTESLPFLPAERQHEVDTLYEGLYRLLHETLSPS
jgi:hypothetical protein